MAFSESRGSLNYESLYEQAKEEIKDAIPPWKEASFTQRLRLFLYYVAIYMPVVVLTLLVVVGYTTYVAFYVVPLVTDKDNPPELYYWHTDSEKSNARLRGWIFFAVVTWTVGCISVAHVQCIRVDPGSIPQEKPWDIPSDEDSNSSDSETRLRLVERSETGDVRTCGRCTKRKPDRTHHCKQCDRCNLKMDHHCNWVANCVGFYNYKYFFQMVFYGALALAVFMGTFWETVVVTVADPDQSAFLSFYIVLSYSLMVMLGVALIGFCIFHFWMISNNYTTIEYCEKRRQKKHTLYSQKSPFDLGTYKNFQEALGRNPWFWFLPFNYRQKDETGLFFEVQE